jgi:NTE family protein
MRSEVLDLMRRHVCFQGLEDDALAEIAEHMELVQCKPNECLHQPNTPLTDIYFVVQGTLKGTRRDLQGNERVLWVFSRDDQIGAVMAGEVSIPEGLFAVTDCTLLKLEYKKALSLTPKYPKFRINLLQAAVRNFRKNFIEEKSRPQPWVVAIFHSSPATRPLTQRLIRRLAELGEQPRVLSDQNEEERRDNAGYRVLSKGNCELFISEIREQIGGRRDMGRLFIDVDAALDPDRASQLIELSDSVMWCVRAGDEKSALERLKANCAHASHCREKINLVWLLEDGCRMSPFAPELNELVSRDFKVTFSETESPLGKTSLERVIHYLRGIKIGLALGGGAARGTAHLGVLHVLEQNGIVVDMIAGTSAGAMTGVPYASGLAAKRWAEIVAVDLKPPLLFRYLPDGRNWHLMYLYRTHKIDAMLRKYLSDCRLEQLPIPCCAVTLDLVSGEAVIRDHGDAVIAILESINLPGLSLPIIHGGQALVDGGVVKNIPADVLVDRGCNYVIAVSVTAKIEQEFPTKSAMGRVSTMQTIMRSLLAQNMGVNSFGVQPADAIIEPDVTQFDLNQFTEAVEIARIGELSALAELPKIKEQLQQLDYPLFADVAKSIPTDVATSPPLSGIPAPSASAQTL